jgi:hypothetical protein
VKKISFVSFLFLFTLACSISFPSSDSFDEKISTKVAISLTATALNQELIQETTQASPHEEDNEPTESPTITPNPIEDPKKDLGETTWSDNLSTGSYWSLDAGDIIIDTTTLSLQNGKLSASAATIGKGTNWWLTYLTFQDAYLEATFDVGTCADDDQYGLVFRAPDYESGNAYYFHVTCDGRYDLRRWSNNGATMLLGMPSSEKINAGSDKTNTLGVWIKGPIIRLYVNNFMIKEISDGSLPNYGHFGLFINARRTPGFTIHMDNISYWTLNS